MVGRNGIQKDPKAMTERMRSRWGREPVEVIPQDARPNKPSHNLIEELYFLSSTGITFEEAQQALQGLQAQRQTHSRNTSTIISGDTVRRARQHYQESHRHKDQAFDARPLEEGRSRRTIKSHQQKMRDPNRGVQEKRIIPAALDKKTAFKTTIVKPRTKHVSTASRSRWNTVQGYKESKHRFEALIDIRVTKGKGRGWFAAQDIPQGTQIHAEKPLIKVETPYKPTRDVAIRRAFDKLSQENKDTFQNLSPAGGSADDPLLSIFNANCFAWDLDDRIERSGVFARTSLLNHDCQPNAIFDVDSATGVGQVRAMVNIQKGTEVTIRYCEDEFWDTTEQRQENLRKGWQFECACDTCKNEGREAARHKLRQLAHALIPKDASSSHVDPKLFIDDPSYTEDDPAATLHQALAYVEIMSGEGITGTRMARAYNIAARLLVRAGRLGEALDHLRAAQRINNNCFGSGSPLYHEQAEKIKELEAKLSKRLH